MGDSWVLPTMYSSRRKHKGSTHHHLSIAGNSHQIGNLSRKHTWVLPSVTSSTGHSVPLKMPENSQATNS